MSNQLHKKTVVVLGNAKSGTSIVAGILYLLGIDIGKKFVEADAYNPKGYFEDYDFVNQTDSIFSAAQSNYWDFPSREKLLLQGREFDKQIQELIKKKSRGKRIWGWKDPWTNILVELFLPYLLSPHFIVTFRNPIDVAKSSFQFTKDKRHEPWVKHPVSFFHGLKLANFYDRIILDFFEKHPRLPRLFISFEDILADTTKEAKRIANFLDVEPTRKQLGEINSFVIPRNKLAQERKRFKLKYLTPRA